MGLEAKCSCRCRDGSGAVKARLEARELIVRGQIKRSFLIADMKKVRVEGSSLIFQVADEEVALRLGADVAERWAKKIAKPPPSLAQKLGAGPLSRVLVIGALDEAALLDALRDHRTTRKEDARLSLAVVNDAKSLERALKVHETLPKRAPIWIVYRKGPRAMFGEGLVRKFMRDAGYKDNKVAAVSDDVSAMRYS
jgi:hypothetical protein